MHNRRLSLSIVAVLACNSSPPEGDGNDASSGIGVDESAGPTDGGSGGSEGNGTTGDEGEGEGEGEGDGSSGSGQNDGDGTGDSGGSNTSDEPTGGSNPTDGEGSDTMDCPSAEVQFEPIVPTVILLVDQSGSMTEDFEPNVERWDAVRDALIDPVDGVIAGLQDSVRFGLSLYTYTGGQTCPNLTEVAPAVDNLTSISDVYADAEPPQNGDTPTGDSLEEVTAALLADQSEGPKIIVLATDGEPDTCAQPNPQNGQEEAVAAVEAAFTAGIETYIIGVGNDVSSGHLQDMANAGVGAAADAPFYRPSDQDDLIATFESIINGVRTCVFELDGAIVEGYEDDGVVTVNGEEIPYQDPNGWDVIDPTHIELFGEACDSVQTGEVEVVVEFPCGAIVPQ